MADEWLQMAFFEHNAVLKVSGEMTSKIYGPCDRKIADRIDALPRYPESKSLAYRSIRIPLFEAGSGV